MEMPVITGRNLEFLLKGEPEEGGTTRRRSDRGSIF